MFKYSVFLIIFCSLILGCIRYKPNIEIPQENIQENINETIVEHNNQISPEYLLGLENNIEILKINTDKYPITDFSFVGDFHQLKVLHIHGERIQRNKNINLDFIKNLSNLEDLWLQANLINIDGSLFSHLKSLNRLSLDGAEIINLEKIFELPNLERLWLNFFNDKIRFGNISANTKLIQLSIFTSEVDLEYIGNLRQLKSLYIHSPKIINLSKLNNQELEGLTLRAFDNQKFNDELNIDEFQNLNQLKRFSAVHFGIHDVSPLINLPYLETVYFALNNIDIMPLIESKSIKEITLSPDYTEINTEIFKQNGIKIVTEL